MIRSSAATLLGRRGSHSIAPIQRCRSEALGGRQRLFSNTSLLLDYAAGKENIQSSTTKKDRNQARERVPFYGLPRPQTPPQSSSSSATATFKQRMVVALRSASAAFRDPTRDDAVAALGEVTGTLALHRMVQQMRQHPTGQTILQDKPIISKATIPYERFLEEAAAAQKAKASDKNIDDHNNQADEQITFGQAYGRFLLDHGFDPDERKPVQYDNFDNDDDAYVMLRYRQCHDYWHTLTGLPPTVLGELGLKWLELFQTGLPIAALSGTVGSLGLSYKQQHILWNVYLPWAIRVHKQQQVIDPQGSLLTVYYEQEFNTPLHELQKRIGIEPVPKIGEDY